MAEGYWYLSFADPERETGTQYLGACIVRAHSYLEAVEVTHVLGINPGGAVSGAAFEQGIPVTYLDRLLQNTELWKLEKEMKNELDS